MLVRRGPRKLKLEQQIKLIQLMNNLFTSGFHLGEIVDFLARSKLTDARFVNEMEFGLAAGKNLADILSGLRFSKQVVTQVALADSHGNLAQTLVLVETNLRKLAQVKKKLIQVASYPLLLLGFLVLIMLGLKNYLLPQIAMDGSGANIATILIGNLPTIFLVITSTCSCVAVGLWQFAKRQPALVIAHKLARLPFISRFVRDYLSAYFAREWGVLISQGLDIRAVLDIMEATPSRIFSEVGSKLSQKMSQGGEFAREVSRLKLFKPELSLMIEYGELKSRLGTELSVYSDECWEQFFRRVDRAMAWVQPAIFLFVALMIVLIYAAMLLPIYSNINNNF